MNAAMALRHMTVEEYLRMEEVSTEKHELIDGVVYAMAGADFPHNQIVSNAHINIGSFLKDKSCRIYGSDLAVHVKTKSGFAYPDLTIVCGQPEFYSDRKGTVTNPAVIIEVLSPDTELYDRSKKFMLYRQIETLREYILVSSTEMLIDRFQKNEEGRWVLMDDRGVNDAFIIETISYRGNLSDIYRDVVFQSEKSLGEETE